jgi:hypothetical protein
VLVVLAILDSLRADAVGFGGGALSTPNLDALASEGTVFESAYASAAWTVPSLMSIATGTFAHRVGVGRWRHAFPERRPTLMSAFAAAGFEVKTIVHNRRWAFLNTAARGEVVDSQNPAKVREALRTPPGVDRFVLLHHWWTHLPYVNAALPRREWKDACDAALEELGRDPTSAPRYRDAYHRTIEYFDRELLPSYLDAAGGGEVLLAVTGDHGENWGDSVPAGRTVEHMYDLHGRWLTDETLHVPLLFWSSRGKIPAGARRTGFVRGVDLAPTLTALAGIPWPGPLPQATGPTLVDRGPVVLDGIDLSDVLVQGGDSPIEDALTVTSSNAVDPPKYSKKGPGMWRRFSLRTADRRYVYDGVDGTREVSDATRLERALGLKRWTERAVWKRLSDERAGAISGPTLPKNLYPKVADDEGEETIDGDLTEEEADALDQQMRLLGYMD